MSSDGEDRTMETEVPEGALSVIAKPLASGKLKKRVLKVVRKSAKSKTLKRGVKEVVKAIRKNAKGLVVLAGDISPIDVLSHVPVLCEDSGISYIFIPSKVELGSAGATRRPTCCVMVPTPKADSDLSKNFDKCVKEIKAMPNL